MSRNWQTYLADIRTACEKVLQFTAGMDRDAFFADDKTYHAVVHCLLIVGEAAKRIPEDIRQQMPDVEWRKISGMRDWMVHAYFAINDVILWDTIETNVPELLRTIRTFEDAVGHERRCRDGLCRHPWTASGAPPDGPPGHPPGPAS